MRRHFLPGPAALLAAAVGLPIAFSGLKSFDLFFHLAGARWILAHGFPHADPFSVTAVGRPVPQEWGFGVLAELALRAFGAAGPELVIAALVCACALLVYRAINGTGATSLLLLVFVLGAISFTFNQERPYHAGHALFALGLVL